MGRVSDEIDRDRLAELCRRHGISRLALFGSAVPGLRVGLRFITIQDELRDLFGRGVDLNTRAFLSRYFRDRVEAEAVAIYEAA